jgi:hypothetical protein
VGFIRFANDTDIFSPERSGLIQIVIHVLNHCTLTDTQRAILNDQGKWFRRNLDRPDLDVSGTESWFKCSAAEHISRARSLAEVVRELDIPIEEKYTSQSPGTILYDDEFQVVSRPSRTVGESRAF